MIDQAAITQWRKQKPWESDAQVEQDLLICRCLVAIYSDEFLASQLAFRGGTALHKLYLSPPTYKQFVNNMEAKMIDEEFLGDTMGLLRPERNFDPIVAYQLVKEELIDRLQK